MTGISYSHGINLDDFRESKLLDGFAVWPDTLDDGQVMIRVDKVALTSNSVTYIIGSQMGMLPWLDVFPAPEGLGHMPCWGFGDVLYSKHPDVPEGERLYGFFPIASHVIFTPGKIHERGFTDIAECRAGVTAFYNEYSYIRKESGYAPEFEDIMMLFRPLFGTSFLLESFCEDQGFFDTTERIIVSSASSKTAVGFGYLLRKNHSDQVKATGLTSARNKDFVVGLNCYDEVLTYDEIDTMEPGGGAAFFDIAGNHDVLASVHRRLRETIVYSGHVGQTHWDDKDIRGTEVLPGPNPVSWSGPDQVTSLRERHGTKGFGKMVQSSMVDFMMTAHDWINVVRSEGPEAIDGRVKSMLNGKINPDEGVVLVP